MQKDKFMGNNGSIYDIFILGNIDRVNPYKFYKKVFIGQHIEDLKNHLFYKNPLRAKFVSEDLYIRKAEEDWHEMVSELLSVNVPDFYFKILEVIKKKDQEKIVKRFSFNYGLLFKFFCEAFDKYGFTFSQYSSETYPKDIDLEQMPRFVNMNDNNIDKVGETIYTDGQLKNAIKHRNGIIANFLDKGETWHCFFITYKSLAGRENWNDGQPHYHYISDKFNLSRAKVLEQIEGGSYPQASIHIPYQDLEEI